MTTPSLAHCVWLGHPLAGGDTDGPAKPVPWCPDEFCDLPGGYVPVGFLVREAVQQWERDEAHALRRAVFCIEQGLFAGDDRDAVDDRAQLLVAMSFNGGMPDQVVGTVRIHEAEPGVWWGSRLAVHPSFRSHGHLGATLIRLAVSRAHAQGCYTFLARVQAQNATMFRKLHWQVLNDLTLHGRPHVEMRADLDFYPPCHDAVSGLVARADLCAASVRGSKTETLPDIVTALRASRGFAHKRDIGDVVAALGRALPGGPTDLDQAVPVGDDCAAIPDGQGGYLLFAIEGLVEDFIERMPRFAGYCSVMVNVSDIYAMGGRPTAVVNAMWSTGMHPADQMLAGMAEASAKYGVPIVGGHSNNRSARPQLAVSILGRANRLLTSFSARPGDLLLMAVDLRGGYEEPFPYWNASTRAPGERLRGDLELLPQLAEDGLCDAAKDISMAGAVGTALMLLECSGVGAVIDLDAIPRPDGVPLLRWLSSFPSFGFILSVRPEHLGRVLARFAARDLAAAVVGQVDDTRTLVLRQGAARETLWDLNCDTFICDATSIPPAKQAAQASRAPHA